MTAGRDRSAEVQGGSQTHQLPRTPDPVVVPPHRKQHRREEPGDDERRDPGALGELGRRDHATVAAVAAAPRPLSIMPRALPGSAERLQWATTCPPATA